MAPIVTKMPFCHPLIGAITNCHLPRWHRHNKVSTLLRACFRPLRYRGGYPPACLIAHTAAMGPPAVFDLRSVMETVAAFGSLPSTPRGTQGPETGSCRSAPMKRPFNEAFKVPGCQLCCPDSRLFANHRRG